MIAAAWRCRWAVARLAVALALLWAFVAGTAARLARLQLEALPAMDFAAEVRHLREARRYGEAAAIADAALAAETDPQRRRAIEHERDLAAAEASSLLRRARDVGMGALSGQGDSIESLVGAVAADMLVVGDIRDILLQGGKWVADGETDEVILALSALGLATTVAPQVDWAPSVLKAARRMGAMTKGLSEHILRATRAGRFDDLRPLLENVGSLSRRASPGGAARILRLADSPDDVATLARFVDRADGIGKGSGVLALHVTGPEGVRLLRLAPDGGADRVIISAAKKGARGAAWLRTPSARLLLRPHPLVGLAKGLWKGNVQDLAVRIAAATDRHAWWIIPLLAAWAFLEVTLIAGRLSKRAHPTAAMRPEALADSHSAPDA